MTDENEEQKEITTKGKLGGIGQEIIGELEIIGGILTADPIAQAEGEFNVETGHLRHEASESLKESESDEVKE